MHKNQKILIAVNAVLSILLLLVVIKENYPTRLKNKLFPQPTEHVNVLPKHTDNIFYEYLTSTYPLYQSQKNIVMLGNSLTAAINWSEFLNRNDVSTRGVPGDLTSGLLARIDHVIRLKPKVVFIECGVNDINSNITQDTIIKNITSIVETLLRNNITPVLTSVTLLAEHFTSSDPSIQNKKIKELNIKLSDIAKSNTINLIDLNTYTEKDGFLMSEYAISDGIHFSPKMYIEWINKVQYILKKLEI